MCGRGKRDRSERGGRGKARRKNKSRLFQMDSLLFYICPLKMELNEGITRLAHFGKPQKKAGHPDG